MNQKDNHAPIRSENTTKHYCEISEEVWKLLQVCRDLQKTKERRITLEANTIVECTHIDYDKAETKVWDALNDKKGVIFEQIDPIDQAICKIVETGLIPFFNDGLITSPQETR